MSGIQICRGYDGNQHLMGNEVKNLPILLAMLCLAGCGVETASTAATVATLKAKDAQQAQESKDQVIRQPTTEG
jgi:hypothetical protein